jgi:dipeptidyl-peptidase-4
VGGSIAAELTPAARARLRAAAQAAYRPWMRLRFLPLCLALVPLAAAAGDKRLTIDDIYDPDKKVDFGGNPPTGLTWIDDDHYLWPKTDPKARTAELMKVEAATGRTEALFDTARVEATLAKVEGVTAEEAKRLAHQRSYVMNEGRTALLLTIGDDLYHYDLSTHRVLRLTRTPGKEEEASLSPNGALAGFVRGNDLYVVEVATQRERRLTADGSDEVLNGKLDWVYQEEVYGRGRFRAYWWSPNSSRVAFLRLDEHDVPRYTIVDDIPYHPEVERTFYPKAGDPNPKVRLSVVSLAGDEPVAVDLAKYAEVEPLIVDVSWTADGKDVAFQVQDREQTWLDLDLADPSTGKARTLFRESTPAWIEPAGSPRWLPDGSFVWSSERTGHRHVYHYARDGRLLHTLTSGEWEARTLHGVDKARGWVYFSGTERSPIGLDVYRVRLDGTGLERLSQRAGTHTAEFNPSATRYLDTWNDVETPSQVRLHAGDGSETRVIDENRVPALAEYRLSKPEFLTVRTRDGFAMEAMLLKPPDFDPNRRYPVYQHTYGGPHAPQVRNAWTGATAMFHQLLAQRGIVVWICDNRTASGKGVSASWPLYRRFGELELRDVEDGVAWLKSQPWVDAARIGINGWSFGGFMVSYALTHSTSYAMGIAGGSVTDWRDYDSIYTERYMRQPKNNEEGYKVTSPRFAAKDLHGRLLLLHGAIDDNVHPQNTVQFAYELQKAGQPFRMMLYPKSRHGVTEPALVKHLRQTMLDFIEETLLAGAAARP